MKGVFLSCQLSVAVFFDKLGCFCVVFVFWSVVIALIVFWAVFFVFFSVWSGEDI